MKQRMYNVFKRRLGSARLAALLSNVGYALLMAYYAVAKVFMRGNIELDEEKARQILSKYRKKPDMDYTCVSNRQTRDLSVIIPAYNVADTILECVNSVIGQYITYDYEVIVVDDGSTDSTPEKLESISDKHLVVIHQKNGGLSAARNTGLDNARGKYVMFVDSDDYLVGDCIEKMMDTIIKENADIVQGSYYSFENGNDARRVYVEFEDQVLSDTEKMTTCPGFAWGKIYRKDLWNNIRFPMYAIYEDTIICTLIYRICEKIALTGDVMYAYRMNPKGITQKSMVDGKCLDHYWIMEHILEKADELHLKNDELFYNMVLGHMSTLLYRRIHKMDDEAIRAAFVLAGAMLKKIRPQNCKVKTHMRREVGKAFASGNYKRWKLISLLM